MTIIPLPTARPACGGHRSRQGRLLLPVAPLANHQLRFAPLTKDAPPLSPTGAVVCVEKALARSRIKAVEIAGPGDPLAVPDPVIETLSLVRHRFPGLSLHLASVGIGGEGLVNGLIAAGLDRFILLVEAATPERATHLYAWIRPGRKTVPLPVAARILVEQQAWTVAACRRAGLPVEIRTTVFPGRNDIEIEKIADHMAALGATAMTLVPFLPAAGSEEEKVAVALGLLTRLREIAGYHLPCTVAEPDFLDADEGDSAVPAGALPSPSRERPNVGVVSSNGVKIDLHLGQAIEILIYGPREDGLPCLLGSRPASEPGGGDSRWETLAITLGDCFALLTAGAGKNPSSILARHGVQVILTESDVEGAVDHLYSGGRKGENT